jgi:trehalose 6-phosphate synthase/phosphatase
MMKNTEQSKKGRLIVVAYRLPFKYKKKNNEIITQKNAGGLVSAVLSLSEKLSCNATHDMSGEVLWFGKAESPPVIYEEAENHAGNIQLHPVHISKRTHELAYGGFCNNLIWPLFHYFPWLTNVSDDYFRGYVSMNQAFFRTIREKIQPGDFIWIHDYHFFLLPQMIRQQFPQIRIGFFLHIPFPSFEVCRIIPREWRNEIFKGLLGADLVGFHTKSYSKHFIESVKKSVPVSVKGNVLKSDERCVKAAPFPLGIDFKKFHDACLSKPVMREKNKLRKSVRNHRLIFSAERLDYTKGLLHRLFAFEHLLETQEMWHEKVMFNMVVVPSRDSITQYRLMLKEIEANVGRINGKYGNLGWRPVIYQYRSLGFNELVAMYDLSDVALITPLRDGMNLVAKEYVACQVESKGVLILSELAGASDELREAIIINPFDLPETAHAIHRALQMPEAERTQRIFRMQERLKKNDIDKWLDSILTNTNQINESCRLKN